MKSVITLGVLLFSVQSFAAVGTSTVKYIMNISNFDSEVAKVESQNGLTAIGVQDLESDKASDAFSAQVNFRSNSDNKTTCAAIAKLTPYKGTLPRTIEMSEVECHSIRFPGPFLN